MCLYLFVYLTECFLVRLCPSWHASFTHTYIYSYWQRQISWQQIRNVSSTPAASATATAASTAVTEAIAIAAATANNAHWHGGDSLEPYLGLRWWQQTATSCLCMHTYFSARFVLFCFACVFVLCADMRILRCICSLCIAYLYDVNRMMHTRHCVPFQLDIWTMMTWIVACMQSAYCNASTCIAPCFCYHYPKRYRVDPLQCDLFVLISLQAASSHPDWGLKHIQIARKSSFSTPVTSLFALCLAVWTSTSACDWLYSSTEPRHTFWGLCTLLI